MALDRGFLVRFDKNLHEELMKHKKKTRARSAAGLIRTAVRAYLNGDCADRDEPN